MPKGIPIIVQQVTNPDTACPIASHHPQTMNQTMLPRIPSETPVPTSSSPVSSFRDIASRPKGTNVNLAMTKHDLPQGMKTTLTYMITPARSQPRPITIPPKMNQMKFPIALMGYTRGFGCAFASEDTKKPASLQSGAGTEFLVEYLESVIWRIFVEFSGRHAEPLAETVKVFD